MKLKKILSLTLVLSFLMIPIVSAEEVDFDRNAYYDSTIAEYGEVDFSDPQFISDENFFGVWTGNGWQSRPYFAYDLYPGLSKVEDAAKQGDYETCKEEILKYYRDKFKKMGFSTNAPSNVTDQRYALYEAMMDNFYCESIQGRINFGTTAAWSGMDVLANVQSAASGSAKSVMFQFAAAKKDGYQAVIHTKESGNAPYIRALVNGAYRNYPVKADTYVTAAEPTATKGTAREMFVEESVDSIDIHTISDRDGVELRDDPYRKVAVVEFDFSDLTVNDQVTEATLYMHGYMKEAESPGGIRVFSDLKSLFAITYNTTATVAEGQLNYQTWKGKTPYYTWSGETSPGFLYAPDGREALENIQAIYNYIDNLGRGYVATEDERFVWHLLRVQLGLIRANGDYDTCFFRSVDSDDGDKYWHGPFYYANKATFCGAQYTKRYIQSEMVTPEIWTTLLKDHWNTGHYLANVWLTNEENGNFGSMAARGLADLSMVYPEFAEAHDPLTDEYFRPNLPGSRLGGWIAVAAYRLDRKSTTDLNHDGSSIESANAYVIQILNDLKTPLSTAELVGTDATPFFTENMIEQMTKGALYLMDNTNPWFGDWQYGDGDPYTTDFPSQVYNLTRLSDHPVLKYFATKRAQGTPPENLTKVWDTVAKVNFRNSWSEDAVAGHLENSNNPSHGHNDDLHLSVAAYGNYLLVDTLEINYNVALPAERWLSSTRGHNTVEINNTTAKGARDYRTAGVNLNNTALVDYFGDTLYYPPNSPWEVTPAGRPTDPTGNGVGDMHKENRELNHIYDYIKAETFGYENHDAMKDNYQVIRDILFLRKGYFIVTDYIKPSPKNDLVTLTPENTYKQHWHFLPDANITSDREANTIRTNFDGEANIIVATVNSGQKVSPKLKDGLYGTGKPNFVEAKYGYFEQTTSGTTTFNTILYPLAIGENKEITTNDLDLDIAKEKGNAFQANIRDVQTGVVNNLHYYTLFDTASQSEREFGDYSTDSLLALAEKSGNNYETALLRNGKILKNNADDTYLVWSTEVISDLGIEWNGTEIDLAYDENEASVDLTKLTVAANGQVSAVRVNGEDVSFRQDGKYVYFGDVPLLEDSTITEQPTKPIVPVAPSVHGGGGGGSRVSGSSAGGTVVNTPTVTPSVPTEPTEIFSDISGHWASEAILLAARENLIQGDENGQFHPDRSISRAELVAIAMRAMKAKDTIYYGTFADVTDNDWYSKPVAQALSLNIISADTTFRPNDFVTREEMCKILMEVAEALGMEQPLLEENITFTDSHEISTWAEAYIQSAVAAGLMQGVDEICFAPKGVASRAQAVTVIQRLLAKVR